MGVLKIGSYYLRYYFRVQGGLSGSLWGMGEWVIGTSIGDLKGLSSGCIPPFPNPSTLNPIDPLKGSLKETLNPHRDPFHHSLLRTRRRSLPLGRWT